VFSETTLDGTTFYFTSAAANSQLSEVLLKSIKGRNKESTHERNVSSLRFKAPFASTGLPMYIYIIKNKERIYALHRFGKVIFTKGVR
jgi:hypothetical protein